MSFLRFYVIPVIIAMVALVIFNSIMVGFITYFGLSIQFMLLSKGGKCENC